MAILTAKHPLMREIMRLEGQAEIIDGEIVQFPPSGALPGLAAGEIQSSLQEHAKATGQGRVGGATLAFLSSLPQLRSFCADVSFFEPPVGGGFDPIPYPPRFAVEVREADDTGPQFERALQRKIADYFAAGTLVIWDVDLQSDEVIVKYNANAPLRPQVFRRGEVADAQPAVPGWTMNVNQLFVSAQRNRS